MKLTSMSPRVPREIIHGAWQRQSVSRFATSVAMAVLLVVLIEAQPAFSQLNRPVLGPGYIIYTGYTNNANARGLIEGYVVLCDPRTGRQIEIYHTSHLGYFGLPITVSAVWDQGGQLVVGDTWWMLQINPNTGHEQVIWNSVGTPFGFFGGTAMDQKGNLFMAAVTGVLQLDRAKGTTRTVSSGRLLTSALCIAVNRNSDLFVTNARPGSGERRGASEIIRVSSYDGRQTRITRGDKLNWLQGIAVNGDDIYVTGMATDTKVLFGIGRVTHLNAHTGVQNVVAEGGYLTCPMGIAVNNDGQLIVADPFATCPQSTNSPLQGALIKIDPATGAQSILACAHAPALHPSGVAVVPRPLPAGTRP